MTVIIDGTTGIQVPDGSGSVPSYSNDGDGNTGLFFPAADTVAFATSGSERLRIDSAGNAGLGVTPSAGNAGLNALQIGAVNGLYLLGGAGVAQIGSNYYFSGGYKYGATGAATNYETEGGTHKWYTAASGTAGNTITFTQAMTLDASGNLGVGTSSPTTKLNVVGTSADNLTAQLAVGETSLATGKQLQLGYNTTASHGYIQAVHWGTGYKNLLLNPNGGDLLVGTTALDGRFRVEVGGVTWARVTNHTNSGTQYFDSFRYNGTEIGQITGNNTATSYVTSSDRRLKENIAPSDDAGSVIDAIQIVKHDWKVGGHVRFGVVAQDLHAVAPEAVSVGDDGEEISQTWGVDYSKLVPMLVKELQSVRARLAALEGK